MTIGLSLSGGGTRGIAHIGILQALHEAEIYPTHIAGVSSGALVGALYAQGYKPLEILEIIKQIKWKHLFNLSGWGKMGLLNLEKMGNLILQYIPHNSFEGLSLPITVSATDMQKGEAVVFDKGELIKPLLASCCVPFLFSPIHFQGKTLVDGGLLNGLLHEPIAHCDFKIGVHVNSFDPSHPLNGVRSVIQRCFNLVLHNASRQNLGKFDISIEPTELGYFSATNMRKSQELYEIGYQAMQKALPEIKILLKIA
jgi:NTE family protein